MNLSFLPSLFSAIFLGFVMVPALTQAQDTINQPSVLQGMRGVTISIQIDNASTFTAEDDVDVDFGRGIEVTQVNVVSPISINVDINVSCFAPIGDHSLHLTNPGEPTYPSGATLVVNLDPARADINRDGFVDGVDRLQISSALGSTIDSGRFTARGDLDGDLFVDYVDEGLVDTYFGTNQASACNAP